ncbi:MAG TPA: hypothetical protein PKA31_03040 [Candidatus Moranbacteria bacterium]|nr:hypothetical protein [Candidatus Moranbacteria bacterium]
MLPTTPGFSGTTPEERIVCIHLSKEIKRLLQGTRPKGPYSMSFPLNVPMPSTKAGAIFLGHTIKNDGFSQSPNITITKTIRGSILMIGRSK